MKKIIYKLLYICLLASAFIVLKSTNVQAASVSLKPTTTEPTEGQTVTVTASVTAGAWNLQFDGNGKNETIYGYTHSNANASDSKSITFKAGSAGTKYTFTLKGDMTDITADTSEQVNEAITIIVKAAPPPPSANNSTANNSTVNNTTTNNSTANNTTTNNSTANNSTANNSTGTGNSTTQPTKSSEARLSNFGIKPNDFTGFKKDKIEYSTTVPNSVTEVTVYAEKVDSKAKVEGTGKVTLKEGNNTVKVTVTAEDGKTTKTYTLTIKRKTVEEENAENGEARLKILGIKPEEYDFTGFDSEKMEYSVEVPNNMKEIEVYATAIDTRAQVTGTGMIELKEGKNDLKIEVIAVNGTKKTYSLEVTRKEAEKKEIFGLSTLSIKGLKLTSSFKVGTYEYATTLEEDLTSLEIKAKANSEDATVEIVGNENLQEGENVITVLVKNAKTEEVATYQIMVNKSVPAVEVIEQTSWLKPSTWGKEEKFKIAIIIVLIILIICAMILKINIGKGNDKPKKRNLPGAEELDKAIAEHQELSEEPDNTENIEEKIPKMNYSEDILKTDADQNYIEEIAMSRFGKIENETGEKQRRKGRHF